MNTCWHSSLLGFCGVLLVGCAQLQSADPKTDEAAHTYYRLGIGYLQSQHYQIAQQHLKRAAELRPDHADTQTALGASYEEMGESESAYPHYQRAYELAPTNPVVLNNYAKTLCNQEKYAEAEILFMQAVADKHYVAPEITWTSAAICAERVPDLAKAEQHLRKALELNPRYPLALYRLAELLYEQGNALPARAFMQRYAENSAHVAATLWLAAHIECKLGDRSALASFQLSLVKRFPDAEQTRFLMEQKNYDLCKTPYRY